MNAIQLSLSSLLLTGWALAADPAATVASALPDQVTASPAPATNAASVLPAMPDIVPPKPVDVTAEALPILQAKYIDFSSLQFKDGDHLSDLVARSNGRISLVTPDTVSSKPATVITDTLPGNIIYWRLGSFTPEKDWATVGGQLEKATFNATGVILDLRSNIAPDDYKGASQVLLFFAPQDDSLFKYGATGTLRGVSIADHPINVPIVVLINGQTTGAAEALTACLKSDGALVVGRPTAGKAAIFGDQTFPDGEVLRFVVSDISLGELTSLWGHPVTPDLSPLINDRDEKGALILIRDHHVLDVIGESPNRHLLNEAALVQGVDPEWDEYLASLEKKPVLLSLPEIHDKALISALDSLKAIHLSQHHSSPANGPPSSTSLQ